MVCLWRQGCHIRDWMRRNSPDTKETVPSDRISQLSSPPACYGTELRSQNCLGEFPSAPRCSLSKATVHCFRAHLPAILAGTGISQRPFAHPQRLPVSGLPLRGRSSRPATSTPCRPPAKPVRFPTPPCAPVRPGTRGIAADNPLPDSRPALPTVPRTSAPL